MLSERTGSVNMSYILGNKLARQDVTITEIEITDNNNRRIHNDKRMNYDKSR